MTKNIKQSDLYEHLQIPPSRANIKVTGPLPSISAINTKFFQMGLTAADLKPIDWRKKVDLSPVMNQENCGDCWAMSSTCALADRFIIQKNIKNLRLEPAVTAQCAQPALIDQGCGGGQTYLAGKFFESSGVPAVEGTCESWDKICTGYNNCNLPSCNNIQTMCQQGTYYFAKNNTTENLTVTGKENDVDVNATISNIKRELLNGPVVASFFVPKDFMAISAGYKWEATNGIFINGAYNDDLDKRIDGEVKNKLGVSNSKQWGDIIMENNSPAGHAVSIVGWDRGKAGSYGDVSYWIVRNSWGSDWNEDGYFRIAMNDSGLNDNLGLDIPVANLIISSTGQSISLQGFFGGCVAFAPDLSTGAPSGHHYKGNGSNNHKRNIIIPIIIILALLIFGGISYYFLSKKSNKKGNRRHRK